MFSLSWQRLLARIVVLFFVGSVPLVAVAKEVAGWIEMAKIMPGNVEVRAKLDTGAEISSLHCLCSSTFQRDGQEWVRFSVADWKGDVVEMERPVVRRAIIKRHFGASQERLVITMPICIGSVLKEHEVSVVDRGGLEYSLLIGRNFMAGNLLVDSSVQYIRPPSCTKAPTQ